MNQPYAKVTPENIDNPPCPKCGKPIYTYPCGEPVAVGVCYTCKTVYSVRASMVVAEGGWNENNPN